LKTRLHKPKQSIWSVALLLFIVGMVAPYLPIIGGFAFYLVALSAALLLLGTWVI
jgi:hypothetical protein